MPKKTTNEAATAAKKTATLTIDGKSYPIGYDFNEICNVEAVAQCNLLHGLQDLANLSVGQLRGLLLAGIRAGDSKSTLTLQDAGNLIKINTIGDVTEAIAESIVLTLPETAKDSTEAAE
jgi:hypothetical protein